MNSQAPSKEIVARLRAVIATHDERGFTNCVISDSDLRVLLDAVDGSVHEPPVEPDGYIRWSSWNPGGPEPEQRFEYEFKSREDQREGDGWVPLYSRASDAPVEPTCLLAAARAVVEAVERTHDPQGWFESLALLKSEVKRRAAQPPGRDDTERLLYVMRMVSGKALRDAWIEYSAGDIASFRIAIDNARSRLTKISDPTKWDGPTHTCVDNKTHIGSKEQCGRCSSAGANDAAV